MKSKKPYILVAAIILICLVIFCVGKWGLSSLQLPTDKYVMLPKSSDPVTYIVIPQRDRDVYMRKLLMDLPRYLEMVHPGLKYVLVVVSQDQGGKYNKSLSLNVALSWLHKSLHVPLDSGVIIHDVDVIPESGVDYRVSKVNTLERCFMTTGGLKGRLSQFIRCNGYPSTMKGWGYEDMIVWLRMERMCGIPTLWWWDAMGESDRALVTNLEWKMGVVDTKRESNRYWKGGAGKIQFNSGNINNRHDKTWYSDNDRLRNWCFYTRCKDYTYDVFSRVTNSDGLNMIDPSGIRVDSKSGKGVYYLSFAVDDVLMDGVVEPEVEWYSTPGYIPDSCPTNTPA